MTDLEQRLRTTLRADANRPAGDVGDIESLLDRVTARARRRRHKRAVGWTVAALAIVGAAAVITLPGGLSPSHHVQVAGTPNGSRSAGGNSTLSTTTANASLSGLQALSVTATDPQTFWALGTSGCAQPRCLVIDGTSNGGGEFTRLAPPPARVGFPTTSNTVSGLRFASGGADGWAFGGALWATHDGGASWWPIELGAPDDQIVALEVWRTAAYALLAHADESVVLLRASVGSDNWTPVRTGLSLTDVAGGLAVSDTLVAFLAGAGDQTVLASGAAGGWTEQGIPCPHGAPTISANRDSLWLLCSGSNPHAYTSPDAGATWKQVGLRLGWADVIAARGPDQAAVASSYAVDVLERGAQHVVSLPSFAAYAVYIGFTDDNTGYLVLNDGSLLRTSTSGLEWHPVRLPG